MRRSDTEPPPDRAKWWDGSGRRGEFKLLTLSTDNCAEVVLMRWTVEGDMQR